MEPTDAQPWIGATSCFYPLGPEAVLMVPHANAAAELALQIDVAVGSVMREAGVRTPCLITFDESARLLPGSYALFERVSCLPLISAGLAADEAAHAWRELGRDLATVHEHMARHPPLDGLRSFDQSSEVDPRPWLDDLTQTECFSAAESDRLRSILDGLAPAALAPVRKRLCHGDVNAANVLVDSDTGRYLSIIDWAGAGWLDPAWDLASIPLRSVPHVLRGHRQIAPFETDETAEARTLWCHIQFAVYVNWQRLPHVDQYLREEMTRLMKSVEAFLPLVHLS